MAMVEVELRELETRVTWLEQAIRELRGDGGRAVLVSDEEMESLSEREQLLVELKAEGLIRDLTPEERARAAEWDALPEDEKEAVVQEMRNLKPGPMLSDIIIQNRR
jgi:hypothetical protein